MHILYDLIGRWNFKTWYWKYISIKQMNRFNKSYRKLRYSKYEHLTTHSINVFKTKCWNQFITKVICILKYKLLLMSFLCKILIAIINFHGFGKSNLYICFCRTSFHLNDYHVIKMINFHYCINMTREEVKN